MGQSGRRLGQRGGRIGVVVVVAVGATGTAGLGAASQRLVHDVLDGARAAAALGAATETAIYLTGRAGEIARPRHDGTDVVIGQYVAGTHDHG